MIAGQAFGTFEIGGRQDMNSTAQPGGAPSAPHVFISYRRDDTGEVVGELDRRLRRDLGAASIFRDARDLIAGQRFEQRLLEQVGHADAVLVLIGPAWEGVDDRGRRRIDNPDDFVRREVAAALATEGVLPLPVLIDRDHLPDDLPADLEALAGRHAVLTTTQDLAGDATYQKILVGAWLARAEATRGFVAFAGGSDAPDAEQLVTAMQIEDAKGVVTLSRYAAGTTVFKTDAMQVAERHPHLVTIDDETDLVSSSLALRIEALREFGQPYEVVSNIAIPSGAAGTVVGALLSDAPVAGTAVNIFGDVVGAVANSVAGAGGSTAGMGASSAGIGGSTTAGSGATTGAVSSLAAKVAVGALVIGGGGYVVYDIIDGGSDAAFADASELPPLVVDNSFPFGEAGPVLVTLGAPTPLPEDAADAYFRNHPDGSVVARDVTIEFAGQTTQIEGMTFPEEYSDSYTSTNSDGVFRLESITLNDIDFAPVGTSAADFCRRTSNGELVGGWIYDGGPGALTLTQLVTIDGGTVTETGFTVVFRGPADVEFFPDVVLDDTITDNCTPLTEAETAWRSAWLTEG